MSKRINIVSFSGGGIRGIVSAHIVNELERRTAFLNDIHLFAGTSTGSLIAAALASGVMGPDRIISFFKEKGAEIFKLTFLEKVRTVFGLYQSKYSHDGLKNVLSEVFGDMTLGEVKKPLLISSFDLGTPNGIPYRAKYFDNFKGNADRNIKLTDALIASCSAPTFFPAWKVLLDQYRGHRYFIDGGIGCNHPVISSIAAASDMNGLGAYIDEISCIAIGTGVSTAHAQGWAERGVIGWIPDIIDLALEQYSTVNFQANHILKPDYRYPHARGNRYCVINPALTSHFKLDDVKALSDLEKAARLAEPMISQVSNWIVKNDWGRNG